MAIPNGYILFEGPSELDGEPIVVIATGLKSKSSNRKTGGMVQTYILRQDVSPVEAVKSGQDSSICGDCPHRSAEGFTGRTCYVNVGQGALVVWKAYKRGSYPVAVTTEDWGNMCGRPIRFGTYGDPAAAPLWIWESLASGASKITGYTHQWRVCDPDYAEYLMASADTPQDAAEAHSRGYRTFRVGYHRDDYKTPGEVLCPASEEAGKKLTCEQCGYCNGNMTGTRGSVFIPIHGSNSGEKGRKALEQRLIARG